MSIDPQIAVSYAALILADEGVEITTDKLQALLKAAGVEIEPIWSLIFSKALKDKDIKQILTTIESSGPVISGAPGGDDRKVPDAEHTLDTDIVGDGEGSESGSDIGMGLFD